MPRRGGRVNRLAVAREICHVGRRLMERGLIAGGEGNIAVRLGADRLLVTPRGRGKGDLTPGDLVEVDLEGRRIGGKREPSTEVAMHLAILRARPATQAIVHAHPPVATGFATAGLDLPADVVPELAADVGPVRLAPWGLPGSGEVGKRVLSVLGDSEAVLLASHGAVTLGRTLAQAHRRMESLEQAARILLTAQLLGGARRLPPEDVARLAALRSATWGRDA